ncbi:hypothetical protein V8G54_005771, partial [Vigna mungo]
HAHHKNPLSHPTSTSSSHYKKPQSHFLFRETKKHWIIIFNTIKLILLYPHNIHFFTRTEKDLPHHQFIFHFPLHLLQHRKNKEELPHFLTSTAFPIIITPTHLNTQNIKRQFKHRYSITIHKP